MVGWLASVSAVMTHSAFAPVSAARLPHAVHRAPPANGGGVHRMGRPLQGRLLQVAHPLHTAPFPLQPCNSWGPSRLCGCPSRPLLEGYLQQVPMHAPCHDNSPRCGDVHDLSIIGLAAEDRPGPSLPLSNHVGPHWPTFLATNYTLQIANSATFSSTIAVSTKVHCVLGLVSMATASSKAEHVASLSTQTSSPSIDICPAFFPPYRHYGQGGRALDVSCDLCTLNMPV